MTAVRTLVQVSLLAACAATSFVSAQVYMAAKEEMTQPVGIANADPIAVVLADNGDATKPLSPIFPTTKYANLTPPPAKTVVKKPATVAARTVKAPVKVASRPATHMPMRIMASRQQDDQRVTYGYASEPEPRAASIFPIFR